MERLSFFAHFDVTPSSALMFAIGARERKGRPEGSMFRLDGTPLTWPRTIEPGDVRALELDFEMGGDLLRARDEGWDDLTPIAELVAQLEWVSISVYATYRASGGLSSRWAGYLFRQRVESGNFYLSGAALRRAASSYWLEIGREDLAKIVDASFTGRDVDQL
ncbi:MAG: hypothetical protein ACTHK3_08640 [Solirubrobacterales bacterium]